MSSTKLFRSVVLVILGHDADRQLMEDYNTLDRAKDDVELYGLMASGYFAVLSGKIFEFREMDQGDDKVRSINVSLIYSADVSRLYCSVTFKATYPKLERRSRGLSDQELQRWHRYLRWKK